MTGRGFVVWDKDGLWRLGISGWCDTVLYTLRFGDRARHRYGVWGAVGTFGNGVKLCWGLTRASHLEQSGSVRRTRSEGSWEVGHIIAMEEPQVTRIPQWKHSEIPLTCFGPSPRRSGFGRANCKHVEGRMLQITTGFDGSLELRRQCGVASAPLTACSFAGPFLPCPVIPEGPYSSELPFYSYPTLPRNFILLLSCPSSHHDRDRMTLTATKFTSEVMLSAPRRSPGVPNASGTLALYTVRYAIPSIPHAVRPAGLLTRISGVDVFLPRPQKDCADQGPPYRL